MVVRGYNKNMTEPRRTRKQLMTLVSVIKAAFPTKAPPLNPQNPDGLDRIIFGRGKLPPPNKAYTKQQKILAAGFVAAVIGQANVMRLSEIYPDESLISTLFEVLEAHQMSFDRLLSFRARKKLWYEGLLKGDLRTAQTRSSPEQTTRR